MCFTNYSTWISQEIYQTHATVFNLLQMLKRNIIYIEKNCILSHSKKVVLAAVLLRFRAH